MEFIGGFENVDIDFFDMCLDVNGIYKKIYIFILFWVFFFLVVIYWNIKKVMIIFRLFLFFCKEEFIIKNIGKEIKF